MTARPTDENYSQRATLTITEAALLIGVGEKTVRELIADGTIPYLKVKRKFLIPKVALQKWIEAGGTYPVDGHRSGSK